MSNSVPPVEEETGAENKNKKEKQSGKRYFILFSVILLLLLFVATLILLAFNLANYHPVGDNIFNISKAEPGLSAGDDDGIWSHHVQAAVFRTQYENGEMVVIASSSSGNNIIAPGTSNKYTFYLKNTGGGAISFLLSINAVVTVKNFDGVIGEIPVSVKLRRYDGAYIVGSEKEWLPVSQLNGDVDEAALGAYTYAAYTLDWQWEFESGNDFWDTFLGSASVNSSIELTLSIGVRSLGDGNGHDSFIGQETHGCSCGVICLCWLWLIIILILIAGEVVTLVFLNKYMKKCKKYEEQLNAEEEPEAEETDSEGTDSVDNT